MSDADDVVTDIPIEALVAIFGEARPGMVFSEPEKVGDSVVFTASAWERAGGFGFGRGYGSEAGSEGGGSGGGGGGASQGRPVAVIRATESEIQVQPVIDFTKIGVTLLLGGLGVLGVWRKTRG